MVIKTDLSQQQPLKLLKMHDIKRDNNGWLSNNYMFSLHNTFKIHNVIQQIITNAFKENQMPGNCCCYSYRMIKHLG